MIYSTCLRWCQTQQKEAEVISLYSNFCVFYRRAKWPHGDICDCIDVDPTSLWNQKPCKPHVSSSCESWVRGLEYTSDTTQPVHACIRCKKENKKHRCVPRLKEKWDVRQHVSLAGSTYGLLMTMSLLGLQRRRSWRTPDGHEHRGTLWLWGIMSQMLTE